jgi:hypothetical protein
MSANDSCKLDPLCQILGLNIELQSWTLKRKPATFLHALLRTVAWGRTALPTRKYNAYKFPIYFDDT